MYFFFGVSQVWQNKLENVWHVTYALFVTRPKLQKFTQFMLLKKMRDLRFLALCDLRFKEKRDLCCLKKCAIYTKKQKKLSPALKLW